MNTALLNSPPPLGALDDSVEQKILDRLDKEVVIGLETLIQLLPEYSWNQIFSAVDQLARSGNIVLRRHRFDYTLFSTAYAA